MMLKTGSNQNTFNQFRIWFRTSFLQLKWQRNYAMSPIFTLPYRERFIHRPKMHLLYWVKCWFRM